MGADFKSVNGILSERWWVLVKSSRPSLSAEKRFFAWRFILEDGRLIRRKYSRSHRTLAKKSAFFKAAFHRPAERYPFPRGGAVK